MTAAPTVTLATGEVVPSNSPQWRDECLARWQRVVSMRPMSIGARRTLLAEVEAKEGGIAAPAWRTSLQPTGKPAKEQQHERRLPGLQGAAPVEPLPWVVDEGAQAWLNTAA